MRRILGALLATRPDAAALVLRLVVGVVFFAHGAQKALGWFGGPGLAGTIHHFQEGLGIPPALALLAVAAEFLGSLALILGLFTRLAALGIAVVMVVAVRLLHLQHGFFMNWFGTRQGEGYEYHLLVLAACTALMIRGGGSASADRRLASRLG